MADSYHIIDGQVVPFSGGRKCNDTDAWRDATPLELQLQEQLEEYEHTIAAQAAEIEALRAEVEEWKSVASAQAELHDEAERCAEELAKALAELITWIPSADTYRRLGLDPAAPMRALERAKLLLGSGGGLSDD